MPRYTYTAKTAKGEKVAGTVEAHNRHAAMVQIERMGQVPLSLVEAAAPKPAGGPAPDAKAKAKGPSSSLKSRFRFLNRQRMSSREVLTLTTELSDLLSSGMTLGHALTTLSKRRTGGTTDEIVKQLRDAIIQGASLSDAVARYPDTFTPLYVSMIRVGEASGTLGEVLARLVTHYERLQEVKEKVVMALVYPCIVLLLGIVTLIFSMVFVMPKFSAIFEELGSTLPLPTRILIASSKGLVRYGWIMLIALAAAAVGANRAISTPKGRRWWHGFQLRVPLIRKIVAASTFAGFARTLATLLSNGVPVLQALGIVEQTVGNMVIAGEIANARNRVTDGTSISGPLAAGRVFPPLMTDMLAIGEQTGDMTGALNHIARRYETDLDRAVKIFTTALEPMLIVIVAVMVGFVAISILMAVFNLTSGINV